MATTSEHEIAEGVIRVAATRDNGIATFKRLYSELPKYVALTKDDWVPSTTRNGEPMWHQIVRNIKSHHNTEGNAIHEGWLEHLPRTGYKVTPQGRDHIA